jgi:hypothetical protein
LVGQENPWIWKVPPSTDMEAQNFKVGDMFICPNSKTLLVDVDLKLKK